MQFPRILSFGRTGEELLEILALRPASLEGLRVLDCPGGPGSLSAALRRHGAHPTAVDPGYALPLDEFETCTFRDIEAVADQIAGDEIFRSDFEQRRYLASKFKAYQQFLEDRATYPGDYIAASLPNLPFADERFDLVLSSSLLFSYSPAAHGGLLAGEGLGLEWHRQALRELMRVAAGELRVYPAHTQHGSEAVLHPYVKPLLKTIDPAWTSTFFHSPCDQGIKGATVGLLFRRGVPKK
ncbi:hypothetical protein [Cyanobium sp. LEGE 06143]|uniref:hypothetical protein n=1 Tax=Cyanobium sp. LEGE 06143 TaxID=945727 RepID=UPI00187ECD0A|nr:hypothetical protein [Cyanobium sp. LEGE 06143]